MPLNTTCLPCFTPTTGTLPDGSVPTCPVGTKTEIFWYVDYATGCLEKGTKEDVVQLIGTDCTLTTTYFDAAGIPFVGKPKMEQPSYVVASVCNSQTPLPQQDREMQVLCAPDGTKVIVQNVTPDDAPLGTAPTIEAWLLDGTPYAGLLADLGTCGGEQVDVSAVQWFCAAGQSISRTDFWDVFSTPRALLGSIWQDASGAVIAAPAVGTFTVGECSTCPVLVPQGVISNWG